MAAVLLFVPVFAFVALNGYLAGVAAAKSVECPSACSCLGSNVDCSRRGLIEVPRDLPTWVTLLELQSNIATIQEDTFKGMDKLEKLDLSSNELTSINKSVFQHLPSLKELKLNYNKLSEMPHFGKNSSIVHLHLHHNRIHTIDPLVIWEMPHLHTLDLNYNQIVDVTTGTFPAWLSLHQLFLNNNKIVTLEKGCLDNLTSLEWLKLNKNKLDRLPKDLFAKLNKLKSLEMTRNRFQTIDGLAFRGLENLQILKLKRNSISHLMDGAFWGLSKIQSLHLDHNNISVISNGWLYGLKTLKQLSLSHNNIRDIEIDGWEFCKLLWKLDLTHNHLRSISVNTFSRLHSLQYLHLDRNHISHIDDGAFKDLSALLTLEMNNNEISWAVEDMNGAFAGLDQLTRLALNSNRIKSVAEQAFRGLQKLRHLHLQDNAIACILENAFEPLHDLQDLWFNTSNLLCDCQLSWLPKWLLDNGFRNSVNAVCAHPEHLKGKSIFAVEPDEFKCNDFPKPVIFTNPLSQKALKGENVTLKCSAVSSGYFASKFQWKKDGMILSNARIENFTINEGQVSKFTTLLHLENVQDETAGKYQCIISNHFGSAYSQKANISVHVYPSFTKKPEDVTVKSGSTARLECAARGQPPPQIAWQKDGGDDFPAARERRMHVMPTDDVFFIVDVKSSDEGIYSCTATNEAGMTAANASLKVLETPSFTKPMEAQKYVKVGQIAVLECMASGSPKPKLRWLKDNKILDVVQRHFFTVDKQLLIIMQVELSDAGSYTCEMSNSLGTERGLTKLVVLTADGTTIQEGYHNNGIGDETTTTGIIIIAVVCCVVGTSLIWVIIIYQTRKRNEEYSATPTDETTLPEVASSGYNSSDKEGSFSQAHLTVSSYQYQYPVPMYQLKESGYESLAGSRGYHSLGRSRPTAIFPGDVDEDEHQQSVPLTLEEHQPGANSSSSGGNSICSLHCGNSESDTLKSSHSTSSTHTSGPATSLRTFHPQLPEDNSSNLAEVDPTNTVATIHRFPVLANTPPVGVRMAYLQLDHDMTAKDRYHGSQPPGQSNTDGEKGSHVCDSVDSPGYVSCQQHQQQCSSPVYKCYNPGAPRYPSFSTDPETVHCSSASSSCHYGPHHASAPVSLPTDPSCVNTRETVPPASLCHHHPHHYSSPSSSSLSFIAPTNQRMDLSHSSSAIPLHHHLDSNLQHSHSTTDRTFDV